MVQTSQPSWHVKLWEPAGCSMYGEHTQVTFVPSRPSSPEGCLLGTLFLGQKVPDTCNQESHHLTIIDYKSRTTPQDGAGLHVHIFNRACHIILASLFDDFINLVAKIPSRTYQAAVRSCCHARGALGNVVGAPGNTRGEPGNIRGAESNARRAESNAR